MISLKILIVGLGSIGKRHLQNLQSLTNAQFIIYSKQTKLDFSKDKNVKIFNSLDKCLLEKPSVGFITNETVDHIPIAIKLAKNGIDLFIEKPLSNTMTKIKELRKIVENKKLITLMGCNFRFDKCIKQIKNLVDQKSVGKIISVKVECGTYLPDWHPYENYSNSYAAKDELGGGVVLTCIHELDYLFWFFGEIKEVFSMTGKFSNLKISASDLSAIILRFKNNVIVELHLDYFQKPETRSCKIIGTKGTIYWDSLTNEVRLYDLKKEKWISNLKIKNYQKNEAYLDEITHFMQCVKNKENSINDIIQGSYVTKVALQIIKSSKLKKTIFIK